MEKRRRWRSRLTGLVVALLAYLGLFWGVGCTDFFLLHPTRHPIDVPEGRRELIDFDGGKLELWTGRTRIFAGQSDEPRAYVMEFSPNAGRAEYGLMYGIGTWEGHAVEYVAVNYPGYGGSTGKATLQQVHRSALASYDAVAARAQGKPIFVTGMSLGTAAALHVAANRPVAGVLLQNPVPLRELVMGKFGWWNLWLLAWPVSRGVPTELDAIANAGRSKAPAVFVQAEHDSLVPPTYQNRVLTAYAGDTRIIRFAGGHNDMPDVTTRREIREGIEWLWTLGVDTPAGGSRPGGATTRTVAP